MRHTPSSAGRSVVEFGGKKSKWYKLSFSRDLIWDIALIQLGHDKKQRYGCWHIGWKYTLITILSFSQSIESGLTAFTGLVVFSINKSEVWFSPMKVFGDFFVQMDLKCNVQKNGKTITLHTVIFLCTENIFSRATWQSCESVPIQAYCSALCFFMWRKDFCGSCESVSIQAALPTTPSSPKMWPTKKLPLQKLDKKISSTKMWPKNHPFQKCPHAGQDFVWSNTIHVNSSIISTWKINNCN